MTKLKQKLSNFLDSKAIEISYTNKENETVFELEATTGFLLSIIGGVLLGTFAVEFILKPIFAVIF